METRKRITFAKTATGLAFDLAAEHLSGPLAGLTVTERVEVADEDLRFLLAHLRSLKAPAKTKAVGATIYFDAFWNAYPVARRAGKSSVLAKWQTHNLDPEWPAIRAYLDHMMPKWSEEADFKFCPLITTFINQERWSGFDPAAGVTSPPLI